MKREDRYLVFKRTDIQRYLNPTAQKTLSEISRTITGARRGQRRGELQCVVVENDWPEYEHVWELIRLRVEKATIPAETVQGVVDAPAVDAALRSFTEDATNDNAFFLVRAIMEACLPRAPESDADQS